MPYGSSLHIPPNSYHHLAAQQDPYKMIWFINQKNSGGKIRRMDRKNDDRKRKKAEKQERERDRHRERERESLLLASCDLNYL